MGLVWPGPPAPPPLAPPPPPPASARKVGLSTTAVGPPPPPPPGAPLPPSPPTKTTNCVPAVRVLHDIDLGAETPDPARVAARPALSAEQLDEVFPGDGDGIRAAPDRGDGVGPGVHRSRQDRHDRGPGEQKSFCRSNHVPLPNSSAGIAPANNIPVRITAAELKVKLDLEIWRCLKLDATILRGRP